ncbi:MAG: putative virulence factor, partial [Bacteroidales bacterium]|nr:putative virulence factor [Bacteroidales bacterium]
NDLKLNPDSVKKYDEINRELTETIKSIKTSQTQSYVTEDEIYEIYEYIKDVIGHNASNILQSDFCSIVAPEIANVPCDKWDNIFCFLWNKNDHITRLFNMLMNEYKKINFQDFVFVPFDAVLRSKGSLLKIQWLDTICGKKQPEATDEKVTQVYDAEGKIIVEDFAKGFLSALCAEVTFILPPELVEERRFLKKIDLLDFPGARSRERIDESQMEEILPTILRRGKVAYLFNKYSRSLRISSVLFCHHNDQKTEPTLGESINNWLKENIGATAIKRTEILNATQGISPLFFIATKFNIDLERHAIKDKPSTKENLNDHWSRFDKVIPEIIQPNDWFDNWVQQGGYFESPYFRSIYPLRDFFWSKKNNLFDGEGNDNTYKETKQCEYKDYVNYFDDLKDSFITHDFVKKHFKNPSQTWNEFATVGNDGSKAIIRDLDKIASVLDDARRKKYLTDVKQLQTEMLSKLSVYFESEDSGERNKKVQTIVGDIKALLDVRIGTQQEMFGRILDGLMIASSDIRKLAYDIMILKTEVPRDFQAVDLIRKKCNINLSDSYEDNLNKLLKEYAKQNEEELNALLNPEGISVEDIISPSENVATTVEGLLTIKIVTYWKAYINNQVKKIEKILPHSEDVVFTLLELFKRFDITRKISEKISDYVKRYGTKAALNAIADAVSFELNNFVTSVGREYMSDSDIQTIKEKARVCDVSIRTDLVSSKSSVEQPQDIINALTVMERSKNLNEIDGEMLRKLPFWDNFYKWENFVTMGLLFTSDVVNFDPVANAAIGDIIGKTRALYN